MNQRSLAGSMPFTAIINFLSQPREATYHSAESSWTAASGDSSEQLRELSFVKRRAEIKTLTNIAPRRRQIAERFSIFNAVGNNCFEKRCASSMMVSVMRWSSGLSATLVVVSR